MVDLAHEAVEEGLAGWGGADGSVNGECPLHAGSYIRGLACLGSYSTSQAKQLMHWPATPPPRDPVALGRSAMAGDMCIVRRMPRLQVYLPDDLHDELKKRGLPASELLQIALRAELERQDALDDTSRYLEELVAEVGEPSMRQQSQADAIARRIRDRSLDRVG